MSSEYWTKEQLYFDGDRYFIDLLNAIERARTSVFLETYIFNPDPLGQKIEDALIRAARRGVYVRLLVDGIGAAKWIEKRNPEFERSGAVFRVYHPVFFAKIASQLLSEFGRKKSSAATNLFSRLNRRDHRKVCVIDHERAFVGSLNISADHCASLVGTRAWRDTGLQVEGEGVYDLIVAFDHAWLRSQSPDGRRRWKDTLLRIPRLARPMSDLVRLNYTHKLRKRNSKDLKRRLRNAKTRVWLTNAYLAPSAPLVRRITQAAERGVDVRLLVPRNSDVFFMPWVANANYVPLLKAGVRIYEYLPRFLHAKSILIDGWAIAGTSNLNRRSAFFDFEVDLVLTSTDGLKELEAQFERDLKSSEEVRQARGGLASLLGRFFGFVFKRYI